MWRSKDAQAGSYLMLCAVQEAFGWSAADPSV